ncbi:MAG TPA: DUF4124 domain-containing protein [Candidatus Methylomirabilis sp.]|nr:DUF4124 domain-containing protein [Candidatus Methylomirabilis sp.]
MYISHRSPLIMAIVTAIMAMNCNLANSEMYKWIDSQGIVHYSDQPPNKNEISRDIKVEKIGSTNSKVQASGNDLNRKEMERIYNSGFSPNANISDKVKAYLTVIIAKGILSGSDINRIKTNEDGIAVLEYLNKNKNLRRIDIISVFGLPDPRFASPESTWNVYNNARKTYDINTALDCITPAERGKLREIFSVLKREDVVDIGNRVISFEPSEIGNTRATYLIKYNTNGDITANDIVFFRIFGNWKIGEF